MSPFGQPVRGHERGRAPQCSPRDLLTADLDPPARPIEPCHGSQQRTLAVANDAGDAYDLST